MTEMFSIAGKVALVTGGSTGIGAAIAEAYQKAGAKVAITDHTLVLEGGCVMVDGKLVVGADLTNYSAAQTVVQEVEKDLGSIDILVNCAGTIRRAAAEEFSDRDWDDVMAINLDAVWRLSQVVGRSMLQRNAGKIINIASLLSYQGGIRVPSYTASKHAVAGLTKALANEWASRGVNVNAIAPGYIATANTQPLREDEVRNAQILERIPAGRWGEASDLAGAAIFLAASASDYVHGQVLVVDGGWLAR